MRYGVALAKEVLMASGSEPMTALIALNRFGLGARPGDLSAASADPRGFLAQELKQGDAALLAADLPSSEEALVQVFGIRQRRKEERARTAAAKGKSVVQGANPPGGKPAPPGSGMQQDEGANAPAASTAGDMQAPKGDGRANGRALNPVQQAYRDEVIARLRKQTRADTGFVERLVAFWSNHFAVSAAKGPLVRAAAGAFEREAIRPHVLGRFADMLRAVEQHPVMLFYLDNQRSMGPNSRAGRNRGKGLNENLAREILELHTLGADGGYSQADVTALARIITGWTF
jgi:uncharacterized protein (DUF1800 family)